jgi:mevalonate kinase
VTRLESDGVALAQGSAPGKLILFGEHAVVYGHPAIAAAVGLRSTVRLHRHGGPTHIRRSSFRDERLQQAVARALPPQGLAVDIASELPPGRGMGSSASIAVAMVRAAVALAGERPDADLLFERSLALERIFHGQPSGVDNAVSIRGGMVRYRKGPPLVLQPIAVQQPLELVVLDSGRTGSTASLVAQVRAARPAVDPILDAIGALVERLGELGDDPATLGAAMDENHALLRQLGVSDDTLDGLCAFAREHGALGAKLSGAGGGGVVLAWTPRERQAGLLAAAAQRGIRAFPVTLPAPSGADPEPS